MNVCRGRVFVISWLEIRCSLPVRRLRNRDDKQQQFEGYQVYVHAETRARAGQATAALVPNVPGTALDSADDGCILLQQQRNRVRH